MSALRPRDDDARTVREVLAHLDSLPAPFCTHEVGRSIERLLEELAGEQPARLEHARGKLEDAAENVEAVCSAVERERGLEVAHLGRHLLGEHGRGDIGRIAHEHVERALERGDDALREVAFEHIDPALAAQRTGVALCERAG